jgi:hypothetical protein
MKPRLHTPGHWVTLLTQCNWSWSASQLRSVRLTSVGREAVTGAETPLGRASARQWVTETTSAVAIQQVRIRSTFWIYRLRLSHRNLAEDRSKSYLRVLNASG